MKYSGIDLHSNNAMVGGDRLRGSSSVLQAADRRFFTDRGNAHALAWRTTGGRGGVDVLRTPRNYALVVVEENGVRGVGADVNQSMAPCRARFRVSEHCRGH